MCQGWTLEPSMFKRTLSKHHSPYRQSFNSVVKCLNPKVMEKSIWDSCYGGRAGKATLETTHTQIHDTRHTPHTSKANVVPAKATLWLAVVTTDFLHKSGAGPVGFFSVGLILAAGSHTHWELSRLITRSTQPRVWGQARLVESQSWPIAATRPNNNPLTTRGTRSNDFIVIQFTHRELANKQI